MAEQEKRRDVIEKRWQWKLEDLYPTLDMWEAGFQKVKASVAEFESFKGRVANDPAKAIKAYFESHLILERMYAFAHMHRDEDNANTTFQALTDRAESLSVEVEAAASFLEPELLAMEESALQALMKDPALFDFDVYLHTLIRNKPHTLPAEQEKLLAMTGEMAGAPQNIFSMLTKVDMKFPDIQNEKGEEVSLTEAGYGTFIRSSDRRVRKDAFTSLFETYTNFGATIAAAYSGSVKGDLFAARARGFETAVSASLFPDEIPLSVYDNLISVIHESLPALNEYIALRKPAMSLDEIHLYDLYTSMVEDYDMKLPYPEAYRMVMEGLSPLGTEYQKVLKGAYEDGWIDVYSSKAKSSGAYSWGAYGVHPYVLLNHRDDLDSAMTIAHEMGHAMHSYFSNLHQPAPKANYTLFAAEVASTCNEIILMTKLMEHYADNRKALAYLCNHLLEQFRTTVFRQTMFAEFERISHRMAEEGEALTKEALSKAYLELNQKYYGQHCVVDELIAVEWMRIPHFYRAFYVYKYATGFSAAVFLANRILTEGEPAVKDYYKFLSAGGSLPPIEALKLAGVDMSSPEPIRSAMRVFKQTTERLAKLL
jgi:oligoendopeptidase F